jgi:hypothetical protein
VVFHNGHPIRFAQDCCPIYGTRVWAFEITELSATRYGEQALEARPVLDAGGCNWNESGMHHVDAHSTDGGQWIACVDGFCWNHSVVRGDPEPANAH